VITRELDLAEISAIISSKLAAVGISICVVGGSAVTLHAPDAYTSMDIDLAILSGIDHPAIETILEALGYSRNGRVFEHPNSVWTIDIVADTPYIASRPITTFAEIETKYGRVRTYLLEDALADRIAAFLFWNDSQSLDVAERLLGKRARDIQWSRLADALQALDATDPASATRLEFALERLRRIYAESRGTG
jgi:hypothetical protein